MAERGCAGNWSQLKAFTNIENRNNPRGFLSGMIGQEELVRLLSDDHGRPKILYC